MKSHNHSHRHRLTWPLIFPLAALIVILAILSYDTMTKSNHLFPEPTPAVSQQEKKQIDTWIQEHDLNQYGDPKGTAYAGGNPLFNMADATYEDKYVYIVKQHTDKPWLK